MKRLYADVHRKIGGFDLNVLIESDADRVGILGESGSGKSMTLRSIAGIENVDSGHIEADGRVLYDSARNIDLRPQKRNVAARLSPAGNPAAELSAGVQQRLTRHKGELRIMTYEKLCLREVLRAKLKRAASGRRLFDG